MKRGASYTTVDSEVQHQGSERAETQNDSLSLNGTPMMTLPQNAVSPLFARPRGFFNLLPDLTLATPIVQSPLIERRARSDRSATGFVSTSGNALSASLGATAKTSPQVTTPGVFPIEPVASFFGQDDTPLGRWPLADQADVTSSIAAAATTDAAIGDSGQCSEYASFVIASTASPPMSTSQLAPKLSFHSCTGSSLPPQVPPFLDQNAVGRAFSVPRLLPSSCWRTWRLILAVFCFLNGFLAFLFAWMMSTEQTAFAIAAAHRHWNLQERAAATRMAGVYYTVIGLVCLIDGVSAMVSRVAQFIYHDMRVVILKGRHTMRVCIGKVTTLPICTLLFRRCSRRACYEENTVLLAPRMLGPATSMPLTESNANRLGGGVRELVSTTLSDVQDPAERDTKLKPAAPMPIRRRGN